MTTETKTTYQCGCGEWMGERCAWTGPAAEMVVVRWVPPMHRGTAQACGSDRGMGQVVACHPDCAEAEVEDEPEWACIVDLPVAAHAEEAAR